MRVGFVTQWFPPEPGTLVAAAIADGLASRGHEVHVLTGFPNYPSGELQPGYPIRPYRRDVRSAGVTVHRAPLYPSHDASAARRMVNYLTFGISATVIAQTKMPTPDVWLIYSSPATAALPALLAQRRQAVPVFLLIQDLWPDSVAASGFVSSRAANRVIDKSLTRYCGWMYERAAGIGVISPSMRRILAQRDVDTSKIHLTQNWVEDADLSPGEFASDNLRRSLGLPEGRLFLYAGNLGALQGLPSLVMAFARCPDVNLALVGDGVRRGELEELIRTRRLTNVHLIPPQPARMIGRFLAASDIQVVSLSDTPLLRATMPSKVQLAMASGRPILAHAAGDVAELVESTQTGIAAPPDDIDATATAIAEFGRMTVGALRAMGTRARRHYESVFSPAAGLDRLEALLGQDPSRSGLPDPSLLAEITR
jgi:colanic acid biosynthesis glycosyl transferase WcaI